MYLTLRGKTIHKHFILGKKADKNKGFAFQLFNSAFINFKDF